MKQVLYKYTHAYCIFIFPKPPFLLTEMLSIKQSFTVQFPNESLFTMQQSFLTSRGRCFFWKRPELVAYASRSCSVKHHESMIVDRVPRPINARQKTSEITDRPPCIKNWHICQIYCHHAQSKMYIHHHINPPHTRAINHNRDP